MKIYQPLTQDVGRSIFGAGMHKAEERSNFEPTISQEDLHNLTNNGRDSLEKGIIDAFVNVDKVRLGTGNKSYSPYRSLMGLVLSIKNVFYRYQEKIMEDILQRVVIDTDEKKKIVDQCRIKVTANFLRRSNLHMIKLIKSNIISHKYSTLGEIMHYLDFKEKELSDKVST